MGFADANENAIRGGRAAMAKLETRIRELEVELGNVQAHTGENSKGYQKSERRSKELAFQIEEDKKNQDRMSDLANKLQAKIKTYKKQIEEAEYIADSFQITDRVQFLSKKVHRFKWLAKSKTFIE